MKTVLRWAIVLTLILWSVPLAAQTVTRRLQWDQPGQTPQDVPTLSYALVVDATPSVTLVATCAQAGPVLRCSAPLGPLTPGVHTLTLTVTSPSGSASGTLTVGPPSPPVNITIVVG